MLALSSQVWMSYSSELERIAKMAVLIATAWLCACTEQIDEQYATLAKAQVLQEKGWLPNWLPQDSQLLRVQYNLDSNRVFIRLQTQQGTDWLPKPCYASTHIDHLPNQLPSWWPSNGLRYASLQRHYQVYLCKEQGLWWVAAPEHGQFVLMWYQG